jgi:hypothetical protein
MRLILAFLCMPIITFSLIAQTNDISDHRLGIKTSFNLSSMFGTALENPRIKFGYTAGTYFISKTKKKTGIYSEIIGNFKGSNFKNGDAGYSKIALFYVDASLLPLFRLKNESSICIGPTVSYLGLSSLYIGEKKKSEIDKLSLKPWEYSITVYYLIPKPVVSFQFGTKIGLRNINDNIILDNVTPTINQNGTIQNISFEIGMLF